jgi:predicted translin family RNA/ssDNA-binding protein
MSEKNVYDFTSLKEEFVSMQKAYEEDDKLREQIIILSRDIVKPAKQAIYNTHRGDFNHAKEQLDHAKEQIIKAKELLLESSFHDIGSFRAGLEEYIEAQLFYQFVITKKIALSSECNLPFELPAEVYISAIADFTGELIRHAIKQSIKNDICEVLFIQETIEQLFGLTQGFNVRSGDLRRKIDSVKYNLSKIEQIVYDIHMKKTALVSEKEE